MSDLEKAIFVATQAHASQTDKAGQPYILHPLRLMFRFQIEIEMIVAVMHDVIEDSDITLGDLKSFGFSESILEAIDCLSKQDNENYENFISRISQNDLARIEKYHRALKSLSSA